MVCFLYLGSGDEEMEIYDNSEDGDDDDDCDGGIEVEDEDDNEESMVPDKAEGSSTGIMKQL